MARKITAAAICFAFMLALLTENMQASNLDLEASSERGSSQLYGVTQGSLRPQECRPRCTGRCSKTSFKKPCMFFCQKCCATCLCVPPGTYGNKQMCPCYNNWKTKSGGPKCP